MPPKQQHQDSSSEDEGPTMKGPGASDPSRFFNVNYHREFMAKLPETIRNRTKLLLSIDADVEKITTENDAKRFLVQKKFYEKALPLLQRRREIILGEKDVTDEEAKNGFPAEHEGVVKLSEEGAKGDDSVVGLPNFWLDALKHHVIVNDMISERDEDVLSLVQDVQFVPLENGFSLLFSFPANNEYFAESQIAKTVLTKKVFGEEAFDRTIETPITWCDGKDVTVETTTKKQTNKAKKGAVRYVSKTEPCESFFNMFKHHDDPEEMEQYCSMAHAIGKLSRYAVDCVTGIAPDGSSDVEDDGDDEMYGDDEEDEEDSEDEMPAPKGGRGGAKGGRGGSSSGGAAPGEKECKQQ